MNLKKFKDFSNEKSKQKLIISVFLFILLIGGILLYRSYAHYEEEKTFNVLQGIIPDFGEHPEIGTVWTFEYSGKEQLFEVPYTGNYKVELWGASRGSTSYTSGEIKLTKQEKYFIYIGGKGHLQDSSLAGGYNGGGSSKRSQAGGSGPTGSGATDMRLKNGSWNDFESLKSRIMVAAGDGGGLIGYNGGLVQNGIQYGGIGAKQTSGGPAPTIHGCAMTNGTAGGFGFGGVGGESSPTLADTGGGAGGGSGYYGGSGASGTCRGVNGGGSGSSFISGHNGCDAIANESTSSNIIHTGQPNHYSGKVFTNTIMIDGAGYSWTNEKGEIVEKPEPENDNGNGYAKITLLSLK